MRVPVSQRHDPEFNDRNLWLQLSLGLIAAARRLDALLARHAVPAPEGTRDDPRDDALVHAVLGLIALRARWMATVTAAASTAPAPVPVLTAEAPAVRLRDLLR